MLRTHTQRTDERAPTSGGFARTQADVGAAVGLSKDRVFQIEKQAIAKLRRAIALEAAAAGLSPVEWLLGGIAQ